MMVNTTIRDTQSKRMVYVQSREFPTLSHECKNEIVAKSIKVVYLDDINIIKIHEYMCRNFVIQRSHVPRLMSQSKNMSVRSTSHDLTCNQSARLKKKSLQLQQLAEEYASDDNWNMYISSVEPCLNDYYACMSSRMKGIIQIGSVDKVDTRDTVIKRQKIIDEYFKHLAKHIVTDISRTENMLYRCEVCNEAYNEAYIEDDTNMYTCGGCGHSFYMLSKEITYHDPYHVSPSNILSDVKNNFMETINRFMGKQINANIPSALYKQFDKYLYKINNKTGVYYKSLPVQTREHVERIGNTHTTTVSMIITILKETDNSLYYDDINLIGHVYFGWLLPDLTRWIGDIMIIYDLTKAAYDRTQNKRVSVLNGNVILYFILCYLKIPCSMDDFKLMDTKDSFDNYKENWKMMTSDPEVVSARDVIFKKRNIKMKKQEKLFI